MSGVIEFTPWARAAAGGPAGVKAIRERIPDGLRLTGSGDHAYGPFRVTLHAGNGHPIVDKRGERFLPLVDEVLAAPR